jgi:hypothetical protein
MSNFLIIKDDSVQQIDELTDFIINESKKLKFKIVDIRNNQPQQMINGEWRGVNKFIEDKPEPIKWLVAGISLMKHSEGDTWDVIRGGWDAELVNGYLHISHTKIANAYIMSDAQNLLINKMYDNIQILVNESCNDHIEFAKNDYYTFAHKIAKDDGYVSHHNSDIKYIYKFPGEDDEITLS